MSNASDYRTRNQTNTIDQGRSRKSWGHLSPGFGKVAFPALAAVLAIRSGQPKRQSTKVSAKR